MVASKGHHTHLLLKQLLKRRERNMTKNITETNYIQLLDDLKKRVASSRYKATLSVNRELILLYHHIGTEILKSQEQHGWGAKIISQLSRDLRSRVSGNERI